MGNVIGHLIPGDGNDPGMTNGPVGENRDIRGATTNVHQTDAELLFIFGEHSVGRGQLLENDVVDIKAAAPNTFFNVLGGIRGTGHQMHFGFQTDTRHAERFANTFLIVDNEFLGQDMEDLLVSGNRHGPRRVDNPFNIQGQHLAISNGHDTVGIQAADVTAGDPHIDRVYMAPRHQLGFFNCPLNGMNRGLDVDHHTLFQAGRRVQPGTDDFQCATGSRQPHDCHDF